jgi:acyl-CoA synthetase (AMP-forming)/AMP-acid ligase II
VGATDQTLAQSAMPGARALGATLAELIWLRSYSAPAEDYLEDAASDRRIAYGRLHATVQHWSTLFDDLKVLPGSTVAIAVADPLAFAIVFLGVISSGRWAAPVDPDAPDPALVAACRHLEPATVIADRPAPGEWSQDWIAIPPDTFDLVAARRNGDAPTEGHGAEHAPDELWSWAEEPSRRSTLGSHGGGVILLSSGTTGTPKVMAIAQRQLLHTARTIAAHHQLGATDRGFCSLPLFHINAEVVGLLATLVTGCSLVLDRRFHRNGFWALMTQRRITWINAVPAIVARLAELAPEERVPEQIRFVRSASAPLPVATLSRFEQATGVPVLETYGMTEAASQITANPLHGPRKAGSVGLATGVELVVRGDDGVPSETGAVGVVTIRGPGVVQHYLSSEHNAGFDAAGWLDTGDLGFLDEDGYLTLVGRRDDVINRGGEKVLPREIEEVLLDDPDIEAAVAVGEAHPVLGAVPVAYVVVRGVLDPASADRAQVVMARVRERCAERLGRAKRPVAYHTVGQLPTGPTNKVQRRKIRDGSVEPICTLVVQ